MVGKFLRKLVVFVGLSLLTLEASAQNQGEINSLSDTTIKGCTPLEVDLIPNTSNASSYFWDFGNGSSSTLAKPTAIYLKKASYNVMLVETDALGNKDTFYSANVVEVLDVPVSNYSYTKADICEGAKITFQNTSKFSTNYFWDFGDGYSSTDANPVHIFTQTGTYTVKLLAINDYDCKDVLEKKLSVTVEAKPKAAFTVNQDSTCDAGFTFQFTSTDKAAQKWFWSFGDGNTSTNKTPTHIYNNTGTFTVSLVTYNNAGCSDTLTRPGFIYIEAPQTPTFTISDLSTCTNSSIKFSYTGPKAAKYLWDFGDGKTSKSANPSHAYSGAGSYTVKLQVVTNAGCVNSYTYPDPISIRVTNLKAYFTGGEQGCGPLTVNFTNKSLNAKNYIWDFGDGSTSTDKDPQHIYTVPGKYLVKLVATSSKGDCEQEYSVKDAVVVFEQPVAAFQTKNRGGCPPYKAAFQNTSTNGNTWLWNFGDGTTSTDENPEHIFATEGKFTVTLTAISSNGCVTTTTIKDYIETKNITTNYVSPAAMKVCGPYTTSFSHSTVNGIAWEWNFGDGTTSTEQTPIHTFNGPGKYVVSLKTTSVEGCIQYISNFQTIIIENIQSKFSFERKSDCPPYEYYFKDLSTNAVSWLWNFGDGKTSTAQHPTHKFASSGEYNVTLTVKNASGCTSVYKMKVSTPVFTAKPSASYDPKFKFPLFVSFKANAKGATSYHWDFGDKGATSTKMDPTYTYQDSATYFVTLTITDGKCTTKYVVIVKPIIPNEPKPKDSADFTPSVTKGCVPFWVDFTNKATGSNLTYHWDFGDGDSSVEKDPLHIYTKPGFYTVTYTETNTITKKVTSKIQYIRATQPAAKFVMDQHISEKEIMVVLTDSSKNAISWNWDFGDGTTSTDKNPVHTYLTDDKFVTIKLTITDSSGCSNTSSQIIYIGETYPIKVNATSLCKQDSFIITCTYKHFDKYSFNFGDGTVKNISYYRASHLYKAAGKYLPSLKITDKIGRSYSYILKDSIEIYSPKADFIVSGDSVSCEMVTLTFTNKSEGAEKWLWTFSDGTTSTEKNPVHIFRKQGKISATLSAISANCKDDITKNGLGEVLMAKANFTTKQQGACFPITVQFFDMSKDAVSWFWDFGNGSTSTDKNPTHTFTSMPKNGTLLKIIDKNGCTGKIEKQGVDLLDAKFKANVKYGCGPLAVTFTALDVQATTFFWNFGDGNTSTEKQPLHVYENAGKYTVSLRVGTSTSCLDTLTLIDYITVSKAEAEFTSPEASSCAPAVVTFQDKSDEAVSWLWEFGDGSSSTLQNPAHLYTVPGFYDVKLIITNKQGCRDTMFKANYIHVRGPISKFTASAQQGCLPFKIAFTDASENAVSWKWNFGDGNTSTEQNPEFVYTTPGKFYVTLITKDSTGCESSYTMGKPFTVSDTNPPVISPILAVSVVSDKAISIQWTPNAADDFKAYLLYRENALTGKYDAIFTTNDKSVITYTDNNVNTTNTVYLYKLQTIDICGNTFPLTDLTAHGNINIEAKPQGNNIAVEWTPYIGCPVNTYTLYRERENAAAELVTTLPGNILNYVDSSFNCPVKYTYRVVATDLCGNAVSSWSDVSAALPANVVIEQKSPVIRTTVLADANQTLTEWQPVAKPEKIDGYNILRSIDGSAFTLVASLPKASTSYFDENVDVNKYVYVYRVMPANSCNIEAPITENGNSILLKGEGVTEELIRLQWNHYLGWPDGVDSYMIERQDVDGNWETIGTVPGNTNTFDDKDK
ncbi:MAG: PKD domain-containing protein [Bacteroidia bacterium]